MAQTTEPGRIRQLIDVLGLVVRRDKLAIVWLALGTLLPLGVALYFTVANWSTNIVAAVVYIVLGIMAGALGFLIVLGRLTQRLMYSNLEGQVGAVSALIKNQLRRSWRGSEVPVRMNRQQDTVYRLVGRPGIVIVSEGQRTRVAPLVDEAKREAARIVPNIPIHVLHVGADGLPLREFFPTMYKIKGRIRTQEIVVVSNRLNSVAKTPMSQMPKGIDPTKMRAPKPR
jgi:hypothetical protein